MAKETNLTALNEIAEKCGGTAQASNAKAIKEIADNFSGGGGGGASALVAEILIEEATEYLDKTWQEIVDAMPLAYVHYNGEGGYSYCPVVATVEEGGVYAVAFFNFMEKKTDIWRTNASNGHPEAPK